MIVMFLSNKTGRAHSAKLCISVPRRGCVSSLPEWATSFAGRIVVGMIVVAVTLLILVLFSKEELQDCRDEEKNSIRRISITTQIENFGHKRTR